MKHISVKLSDKDYLRVMKQRGNRTTSDYIRDLLFSDNKTVVVQETEFQNLFANVSAIRTMIETALNNDLSRRQMKEEHNDTDFRKTE